MSAIRNACVARGTTAGPAPASVYTVAAATVFLLKDVHVTGTAGSSNAVHPYLSASGSGGSQRLPDIPLDSNGLGSWSGWLAMNAGDQLYFGAVTGGVQYWVSGAVLPYNPPTI